MIYLKRMMESKIDMSDKSIQYICNLHRIKEWKRNDDGTIDIEGDIILNYNKGEFPLPFRRIFGNFSCKSYYGKSLESCPTHVHGDFDCSDGKLETLIGGPIYVGKNFNCSYNSLKTLDGSPSDVYGDFDCSHNRLSTLIGMGTVDGEIDCSSNSIISIKGGSTSAIRFQCYGNPIEEILNIISRRIQKDPWKKLIELEDVYSFYKGNKIILSRFKEALEDIGINDIPTLRKYQYLRK